ncbi:MAG: prephenate dehydrogenase/arogenate dehydrogenase family protein, partial [Armatimonadota bacterium]
MFENKDIVFDQIAIVGVGLIGGSIGLVAKSKRIVNKVVGIGRSEEKLKKAFHLGAIDIISTDFENGAANADLVIICTPVCLIPETCIKIAKKLKKGGIITDAGSTKSWIVNESEKKLPDGIEFIGGHPMAGS